jgi:hypothetical protein
MNKKNSKTLFERKNKYTLNIADVIWLIENIAITVKIYLIIKEIIKFH